MNSFDKHRNLKAVALFFSTLTILGRKKAFVVLTTFLLAHLPACGSVGDPTYVTYSPNGDVTGKLGEGGQILYIFNKERKTFRYINTRGAERAFEIVHYPRNTTRIISDYYVGKGTSSEEIYLNNFDDIEEVQVTEATYASIARAAEGYALATASGNTLDKMRLDHPKWFTGIEYGFFRVNGAPPAPK